MKKELEHLSPLHYTTLSGKEYTLPLTYEVFGLELGTAPIVLINHALTGNSSVTGEDGWWKKAVAAGRPIDTQRYTILCFNIPGNGYDGFFIEKPEDFVSTDIARIFLEGLKQLNINRLFAIVGSSLGGAIAWEMLALQPDLAEHFVAVATDWKTSDWLYAQCLIQDCLLNLKEKPLETARIHAMLTYRTAQSLNLRFSNEVDPEKGIRKSEDWLQYHGRALGARFDLRSYKLMNRLLATAEAVSAVREPYKALTKIKAFIHLISVDSDLFFPMSEDLKTYEGMRLYKKNIDHSVIHSIHGHDAFLMEYDQLNEILNKIF